MEVSTQRYNELCKKVDALDLWINGNGKPGAKEEIALLKDAVDRIESNLNKLVWAVVGLILTILGSLFAFYLMNVIPHVSK